MHNQKNLFPIFLLCTCLMQFQMTSCVRQTSSKTKKFNDLYTNISENETEVDTNKINQLWDVMDEIIVANLNAQTNLNAVRHLITQLRGYQEPRTGQKKVIGSIVFFSEPDHENPTYLLTELSVNQEKYVLGLYTFNDYAPGRLSIYSQFNGKWIRSDKFDGEYPIRLYSFQEALNKGFFITMENFLGADRQEGNVKSWQLTKGRLIKQGPGYDGLIDYQILDDRSSLTVNFTELPKHICEPVMGTRLLFKITYQLSNQVTLESKRISMTPWIEAIDHYFELIGTGKIADAERLSLDDSIVKNLDKDYCGRILKQNGSLEKGEGYVDLTDNEDYHIELKEMNNAWLITGVTKIVSSSDK